MLQTGVTLALSRMVMLLRDWAYDYRGRRPKSASRPNGLAILRLTLVQP